MKSLVIAIFLLFILGSFSHAAAAIGDCLFGDCLIGDSGYGIERGYSWNSPECQKFYDDTVQLRKELHDKKFEYFEAARNPKTTVEILTKLRKEIKDLMKNIYVKAPLGCWR